MAQEIKETRHNLNRILADATGQSIKKVERDTERDHYLRADAALEYGLVDRIIASRSDAAKGAE